MIYFYLFKIIFFMYPVAPIQVPLLFFQNGNQDNDFDKLCRAEFLLMVFLCFYFHEAQFLIKNISEDINI